MRYLGVLLLAALAGCASNRMEAFKQGLQEQDGACRKIYADSSVDPIRAKVPSLSDVRIAPLEMLTDQSRATDGQRQAILAFDRLALKCAQGYATVFAEHLGQGYVAVHWRAVSRMQAARAELYKGAITFGEYVSFGNTVADDSRAAFADLDRQQAAMNLQRQSAAAQSLGAAAAAMSLMPRPLNCTSVRTGAVTTASCQ